MIRVFSLAGLLALSASAPVASNPVQQIDRTAWHIVTLNSKATEGKPHIEFARGQISGSSGCNGFGGSYKRRGSVLMVQEVIATQMACGGKLGMQEKSLFALLGPNLRLRFGKGGLLYISSGKYSAVLRRAAICSSCNPKPAPLPLPHLAGTDWYILSINQKPVSLPEKALMKFQSNRLSATIGCNQMGGTYRIGKVEYLVTGQMSSTVIGCRGPLADEERLLYKLLSDDPWMERVSKPEESIRLRLSSGANEAVITQLWYVGLD